MKKSYLYDIQKLTGVAIFLVVVGHLVTGNDIESDGLEWYYFTKELIYSFHMPLFMFISGYVMYYAYPKISDSSSYFKYVRKKFIRLMPSYIVFATIVFLMKKIVGYYTNLDNPINTNDSYFDAFLIPTLSYSGSLWYIYVLFEYYLVFPILLFFFNKRLLILILITLPLHFLEITDYLAFNFFLRFILFFTLGIYAVKNKSIYTGLIDKFSILFIAFFLILCIVYYFIEIPKIIMGLFSIVGLHSFIYRFLKNKGKYLIVLGSFSFSIYLMNLIVMGTIKTISFHFFGATYSRFYFLAIIMILSGLIIPILIKKYFINKISFLEKRIG